MCTFKITNYKDNLDVDRYLKLGGPDLTNSIVIDNIIFEHNLLSVTGEFTPQPIQTENYLYMLLGEVYNYDKALPSDIYYVIEMHEKYGDRFVEKLDGEYLIVVYDKLNKKINLFTDIWSTRQAWFESWEDYFYFGTFPKEEVFDRFKAWNFYGRDNLIRLLENSHYTFDVNTKKLYSLSNLHKWNLDQTEETFTHYKNCLEKAILKRYKEDAIVCLSGGLDSSVIALCLADHKLPFRSVSLNSTNAEDQKTFNSVLNYTKEYNTNFNYKQFIKLDQFDRLTKFNLDTKAISQLAQRCYDLNTKVVIQGNGSDEIYNNYNEYGKKENKNLNWPENLSSIFPWTHFYAGQNRSLIDKKELIFLSYGLEIRNVFLDRDLTQAWLNLSSRLKNISLKAGLKEYLLDRNIPIPIKVAGTVHQESGVKTPTNFNT